MIGETKSGDVTLASRVLNRPWAVKIVRFLKKARTKAAFIVAACCVVKGVCFRERPVSLAQPNAWVVIGVLLIAGGLAFRLAALGSIRKKEYLATRGVYSLCRHPLYLGSILLAYGFCTLLASAENFVVVTVYFVVFYPLTILREEWGLTARYGQTYHKYQIQTPMLLPLGAFRAGEFTWQATRNRGGAMLVVVIVMLLAGVQIMATVIPP